MNEIFKKMNIYIFGHKIKPEQISITTISITNLNNNNTDHDLSLQHH